MPKWIVAVIIIVLMLVLFPLAARLLTREEIIRFADSPIHMAAKNRGIEVIQAAIDSGVDIDAMDEFGKTPLHYAAEAGYLSGVELLLVGGADAELLDAEGVSALQYALNNGHSGTASVLAKASSLQGVAPVRQILKPTLRYPDRRSFEAAIGGSAVLLKSERVWLFAPKRFSKNAEIVHGYLVKAYDALYDIVGVHTKYVIVVYNFPRGHPEATGGTSECTIRYDDTNLRLELHDEWTEHGVPHVSGYIEEMAHNFNYTQFGWEMVGWSIGIQASERVADNPIFQEHVQRTRRGQADTFSLYRSLGYVYAGDMPANQVDRIHAHLLYQCEQEYGPSFWRAFFKEAKKERLALMNGTRDERYQATIECFDRLPGLNFKQLLSSNKISLTTDIKSLDPESPTWDRRLE